MAGPRPSDIYNPVPSVAPSTEAPNDQLRVEATPADFGGQIGQALQNTGQVGERVGNEVSQYATNAATYATEAIANDKIAHVYSPKAAALGGAYYATQGQDAVKQFQPYMDGMRQNMQDVLATATSPFERQILSNYISKHVAQEYDGAMRHQDQQMNVFENQANTAFVDTQSDNAVRAGSNPDAINQAINAGKAAITMHATGPGGIDPTTKEGAAIIQQRQDEFAGKTAQMVISSALSRGDTDFANSYYANNSKIIPGPDANHIATMLHAENMKSFGSDAATALLQGAPIPPPVGGQGVINVQSAVAKAAQSAGVNPNEALTIAGLESSYGQNLGARGDIGQTGKPAANLDEQAQNLVSAQVQAQKAADAAVGGKAEPWQGYICYQQGVAGGPALIKAASQNPDAKAVDVLQPFYNSPATALSAIKGNGGNATMTAGQFLDFVKDKYTAAYGRASCVTTGPDGQPVALDQAITAPHTTPGVTVQPDPNPVKALQNFDDTYSSALYRANAIPNIDQRNATIEALDHTHKVYQDAAQAWKTQFSGKIAEIITQPDFTSMSDPRLTPDLRASMASDPAVLTAAVTAANRNALGEKAPPNPTLYKQLADQAIDDPAGFIKRDLTLDAPNLPNDDFKKFQDEQERIKAGGGKNISVTHAMNVSENLMQQAGINVNAKPGDRDYKTIANFQYALSKQMEDYRAQNEKPPGDVDIQKMADQLLIQRPMGNQVGGLFGYGSHAETEYTFRAYKTYSQIPTDQATTMAAMLKSRGLPNDPASVESAYTKWRLSGGK